MGNPEKSGIHLNADDSGWPVAAAAEPGHHKDGSGSDPFPTATAVANNEVTDTGTNEVQQITLSDATSGTFTLTFDGQTTSAIAHDASAADVQSALEALPNIGSGDVSVTGNDDGPWDVTFKGELADEDVAEMTIDDSGLNNAINEVQEITVDATGGQFTITFDGQTTADIAFDASAATVTSALEGLSNVEVDDISVTGGPGDDGGTSPYVLTFDGGDKAGTDVAECTAQDGSTPLSGGASTVTVATTTSGAPAGAGAVATNEAGVPL